MESAACRAGHFPGEFFRAILMTASERSIFADENGRAGYGWKYCLNDREASGRRMDFMNRHFVPHSPQHDAKGGPAV